MSHVKEVDGVFTVHDEVFVKTEEGFLEQEDETSRLTMCEAGCAGEGGCQPSDLFGCCGTPYKHPIQ